MKKILAVIVLLWPGLAMAQFDPTTQGVPGVYSARDVVGWVLAEPADPILPTWFPTPDIGAVPGEGTNCNILANMLFLDDAQTEATISEFERMTAEEFIANLSASTSRTDDLVFRNAIRPRRVIVDGLPGVYTEYDMFIPSANVTVRAQATQVFVNNAALATLTCASLSPLFESRSPSFLVFRDQVQFGSPRNIAVSVAFQEDEAAGDQSGASFPELSSVMATDLPSRAPLNETYEGRQITAALRDSSIALTTLRPSADQ